MKTCARCNTSFEGNFCPVCGSNADLSNHSKAIPQAPPQQSANFIPPSPKKHKKSPKPFYLTWRFYLLLVIAIIGISYVVGRRPPNVWPTVILKNVIPEPPSKNCELHTNSDEELRMDVNKISDVQYNQYMTDCTGKGFTIDAKKDSLSYKAYNTDGYSLHLIHYSDHFSIELKAPLKLESITWPASAVGKMLPVPKSTIGKFTYENENSFFVYIGETSKEDYQQYVSACADNGFTVNYEKHETSYSAHNAEKYHIFLRYEGNRIMSVTIESPKEASKKEDTDPKNPAAAEKSASSTTETPKQETAKQETPKQETTNGLRKDFKEAMDSYEAFIDDYVTFMKKYDGNSGDLTLLADYTKFMSTYADWAAKFEKWQSNDLNEAETAYYLEVQTRVTAKLLEVAQK